MKKTNISIHKKVAKWRPWDYGYNLAVEKAMFKKQAKYFESSNLAVGDSRRSEIANLLVKLIDIIECEVDALEVVTPFKFEKKGSIYEMTKGPKFKLTKYINTKNAQRFFNSYELKFLSKSPECGANDLRLAKAWYLYNHIRFLHMRELWN